LDTSKLTLRELQTESARVISTMQATNDNIHQFNKLAHHNSQQWYRSVIDWYINKYGDLPSKIGPAKDVKLLGES
jgi:hypothetical protein